MGGTILAIFFVVLATLALVIAGCVWTFNSISIIVADALSNVFNAEISSGEAGRILLMLSIICISISSIIKMCQYLKNT